MAALVVALLTWLWLPGGTLWAQQSQTDNFQDDSPQGYLVVVVGDSIGAAYGLEESDGWVARLNVALGADYPGSKIINASISGETSTGGLRRLPDILTRFDPDIVIIELGGNDGLRGQSLKLMRSNLAAMVRLVVEHGATPLLLGMRIPPNYGQIYTDRFFNSYATVAELDNTALVPFFLEPIATRRSYFQPDGIHPTADAQPLLAEYVLPALRSLLDQRAAN